MCLLLLLESMGCGTKARSTSAWLYRGGYVLRCCDVSSTRPSAARAARRLLHACVSWVLLAAWEWPSPGSVTWQPTVVLASTMMLQYVWTEAHQLLLPAHTSFLDMPLATNPGECPPSPSCRTGIQSVV